VGNFSDLVQPHQNGLRFRSGDAQDLRAKVDWLAEHPDQLRQMRDASFRQYAEHYSPAANYARLAEIYAAVLHCDAGCL
jgi:glycosyltransferase involved in cell wall biosynthesis